VKVTVSVGGTWNAFRLAEQLDRRGLLHRLVTTHAPRRGERIPPERIAINPVPEILMRGPRALRLRWQIGDYLKAVSFDRWAERYVRDCDVLAVWALFALRSMRAARRHGVRTVLQRGSTHAATQWELLAEEYRRWGHAAPPLDRRLLARQLQEYEEADYIEVTSRFVLETFLDRGVPRERLLHVPNLGIDSTLFHPAPRDTRPFRIVAVGLSLRKGTPYLVQAVAQLRVPDLELWLVGGIPADLAPLLRTAGVAFRDVGRLPHSALADVYRAASVFVLPSIEEGLPQAVLEAMASGLPVIITPNTGGEDLIEHGREGLIVPLRDPGAIADGLLSLYEDEDRRRAMGEAAAESARAWTWDAYGDRAVRAYTGLAKGVGVAHA
jgi:glycosyltransferase involved in cell wall biosynthesis